jgi:hypothetical protein
MPRGWWEKDMKITLRSTLPTIIFKDLGYWPKRGSETHAWSSFMVDSDQLKVGSAFLHFLSSLIAIGRVALYRGALVF